MTKAGGLLPPPTADPGKARAASMGVSDDEGLGRPPRPKQKMAATLDDSEDEQPKTKPTRGTACSFTGG